MVEMRGILEDERRATLDRLATMTGNFDQMVAASKDSNADDEHDPEGATIAFERSQLDAVLQQARTHLTEVDAALARLVNGTYGVCEVCEQQIPVERLLARSTARTCVGCAERHR